jgi:hypothetical protein
VEDEDETQRKKGQIESHKTYGFSPFAGSCLL